MFEDVIQFVRDIYGVKKNIPLHEPSFIGNEKKYLSECIDSTFVSSVGKFVGEFENKIAAYVGTKFAVATTNGTSALHISLLLAGVNKNDEVITQPLTFVASCNAISYCGANPVFVDVDKATMGLSPKSLKNFLSANTTIKNNQCVNTLTGRVIKACLPMHTFGFPCRVDEIRDICLQYNIFLIEDCAESLGSFYKDQHTGTFGKLSVMSFNGNKIITAGGGGCILTNDEVLAKQAKHLSSTAKVSHKWKYNHDLVGYNYRMPNLNAALLIAQLENLDVFLFNKRELATKYISFFNNSVYKFVEDPQDCHSNYWLNTLLLENKQQRDFFLSELNENGIMSRPAWTLMNKLPMFNHAQSDGISNSKWLEDRIVNLPSSPII